MVARERFESVVAPYRTCKKFQSKFTFRSHRSNSDEMPDEATGFTISSNSDNFTVRRVTGQTRSFKGTRSTTFADPFQVADSCLLATLGFRKRPLVASFGLAGQRKSIFLLGFVNQFQWTIHEKYGATTITYAIDSATNRIASISTMTRIGGVSEVLYTEEVILSNQIIVP